jgi:hypothetical protein
MGVKTMKRATSVKKGKKAISAPRANIALGDRKVFRFIPADPVNKKGAVWNTRSS